MKTMALLVQSVWVFLICIVIFMPSVADSEEFGGFGIVVAQLYDADSPNNMGEIVILHVFQGSEAQKSDMRSGDIIAEVDGMRTAGRLFKDIILDSLRGEVGSSSHVTIRRVPGDHTISITVKRAHITYDPQEAS